jgi:ribosomal protein S18 acetylase RimI-like enzyme
VTTLELLPAASFLGYLDEALEVYREAMNRPRTLVEARRATMRTHLTYPGLRAAVALDEDTRALTGFGYGYYGRRGQWWHDIVATALGAPADEWLADSFEVVELHVRPAAQGRGLGRRLLLMLLDGLSCRTAVLSAYDEQTPARRLYYSVGFVDLSDGFTFPGSRETFVIMGRRLPLTAAELTRLADSG